MAEATIPAEVAEANKLEDLTGMGIPQNELLPETPPKPEDKSETKTEVATEEVETKETVEEESESDDGGEDEKVVETPPERPAKNARPLKAIFSQIKELRTAIDALKASPAKVAAQETIDEIKTIAEKRDVDPEGLAEIIAITQKKVVEDLEKSGRLSKDLPEDIQKRLKLLDKFEAENETKAEAIAFESEFNGILPELKKQYPNAKESELVEAKKILNQLAHSEKGGVVVKKATETTPGKIKPYPLDYLIYKNRSVFDTVLKVAKHSKSGELGGSKQLADDADGDDDIDLNPEDMTPEKMKAHDRKKLAQR